jgi:hypothetical protein
MSDDYPEFSVYLFFPDGSYHPACRWVDAETAVRRAKHSVFPILKDRDFH